MSNALEHLSVRPWSEYTSADYSIEQWHKACLIHQHDGPPTSKGQCKLPVKTPDGALNKNGVHAAAAALAGARGGVHASSEEKALAARGLVRFYSQMDESPPASLLKHAIEIDEDFLEHHGVRGMRWGVIHQPRQSRRSAAAKSASNAVKKTAKGTAFVAKKAGQGGVTLFKKAQERRREEKRTPSSTPVGSRKVRQQKKSVYHVPAKRLTDEQLAVRIRRMELEKKYNDLNKRDSTKGKKFMDRILTPSGENIAKKLVTGAGTLAVTSVLVNTGNKKLAEAFNAAGKKK